MIGWRAYDDVFGKNHSVVGRIVVSTKVASPQLDDARDIVVYLPPSLAGTWREDGSATRSDATRLYPVLYFNDGQNVFDEKTAYVGEDWKADETLEALAKEGIEAIAVAISNGLDRRMDEYNPWRSRVDWKTLPPWAKREMGGLGDAYLDYLIDTVKPLIDQAFPTATEPTRTGIIGSSMGGLISIYALATRPATFGLAGVMSPSLGWSDFRIFDVVEKSPLTDARVYIDTGGREGRGMTSNSRRLRDVLLKIGFAQGQDLMYVEESDGIHRESAWARRLPDALRFLLAETIVTAPG